MHLEPLIIDLAWILILAAVTTIIFKWLKQPVVLGYIVAGYLVSNHTPMLPNIHEAGAISVWAEIGIIFLLFGLGLEFSFKKLMNVGGSALISALVIVCGMMISGFTVGKLMGWETTDCVFLGGMLSMSSTTIIIKAFNDLGLKGHKFTGIVFGVLVVEDLFAIILMVMLTSLYVGKTVEGGMMVWSIVKLLFFLILWFSVGIYLIPTLIKKAKRFLNNETLLIISLGLCLSMVVLANYVGFSSALGAFIMGSILAETIEVKAIEKVTQPIRDLFGAVFFVSVGMLVDPTILAGYWLPILIITIVVIIGQIGFSTVGMLLSGQSLRVSIQSGFSLAQIGEFAFIIATLGVSLGVTSDFLYPVAVAVSVITTFTTPFIMRMAEPAYHGLERRLPQRIKEAIDHYSSGTVTAGTQSDWRILLKQYMTNLLILSVMLAGTVWFLSYYAIPFVIDKIGGKWGVLVAVIGSMLVIAPMIWGLTVRKIAPKILVRLWTNSHFNRGLIISLILFRLSIALFFVMVLLVKIYSWRWGAIIGITLITIIFILFSKRIQRGWIHFEAQFRGNLNAKNNYTPISGDSSNLHITKLRISPECEFVGKTISQLRIHDTFHITVVSIKRGVKFLNMPDSTEMLLPQDEVSVIGSDEALNNFAKQVEFHNAIVDTEVERPIVMKQFWLSNSPKLVGQTIGGSNIKRDLQCIVIELTRADGTVVSPSSIVKFEEGDTVWFAGEKQKMDKLISLYK